MRIGLDLDGCVVDWTGSVIHNLNRWRGTNIPEGFQPPSWDWFKENLSSDDWMWIWRGGCEGIFAGALPLQGAREFVAEASTLGDIIIMTSRPRIVRGTTYRWWASHGMEPAHPSGWNFFDSGFHKHKVQVDVLIEDNAEYAEDYVMYDKNEGSMAILIDRPWNARYTNLSWDVERAYSYDQALHLLKERKKNEGT